MENEQQSTPTIKVGLSQLGNPTPPWMSKIANGIIFASLAWAIFSPSITEIPSAVAADITRYIMIASGLIKLATKFFGLDIPNAKES